MLLFFVAWSLVPTLVETHFQVMLPHSLGARWVGGPASSASLAVGPDQSPGALRTRVPKEPPSFSLFLSLSSPRPCVLLGS